jgi:hypothetical protein
VVTPPTPQVTGYLYPWDVLDDPGAAAWIGGAGVDRVALAAAYHSVRAGTPRHPERRVVDARSAAIYVPSGDVFAGRALVPASAVEWTGSENSFREAADVVRDAGLPVDAWTVLTHSSAAGSRNPELCVRNAFGEVYRYALCPSQPQVRDYAATLVAQVLAEGNPDGVVLEAIGPLGFGHQNQHEKTEGAEYSPWVQALLSLCFCGACLAACEQRGVPAREYRSKVREAVLRADDPGGYAGHCSRCGRLPAAAGSPLGSHRRAPGPMPGGHRRCGDQAPGFPARVTGSLGHRPFRPHAGTPPQQTVAADGRRDRRRRLLGRSGTKYCRRQGA